MKIKIVLVETSLPDNIGAVARAMKTMGLCDLALVNPKNFPSDSAYTMASHASDLLDNAQIYSSIADAVADCQVLFGTSARMRAQNNKILLSSELCNKMNIKYSHNNIAILFGPERTGLTNQDLARCDYHVVIPSNPEYSSLNLAQAVQIIGYEIYKNKNSLLEQNNKNNGEIYPEFSDKQHFFDYLEEQLIKNKFITSKNKKSIMLKVNNIFNRAEITKDELNLLFGVIKSINDHAPK